MGTERLAEYFERPDLHEGWMVMFSLGKELTWQEKLYQREVEFAGKKIRIVGS